MKTSNKVQLTGYLGQDPEFREFSSGAQMTRLRLATDKIIEQEGKGERKITTWHTVVAWSDLAVKAKDTFMKGSHLTVEGELNYRDYTNKEGVKVNTTEIKCSLLIDLDR